MRRLICAALGAVLLAAAAACSGDSSPAQQRQQQVVEQTNEAVAAQMPESRGRQEAADADEAETQSPTAQESEPQTASGEAVLLAPSWPTEAWRPLRQVAEDNAALQPLLDRDFAWCAESLRLAGLKSDARWGAAAVSGTWDELPGPILLDRAAQPWIDSVMNATAEARELALGEPPSIQISSRQWIKAESCEWWYPRYGGRNSTRFDARWWWHVSLGLIRPSWTPDLLNQTINSDGSGWLSYTGAVKGSITLLAPLSASQLAHTLSALTVRHLHRDLLDGEELGRSFDFTGFDHVLALYWLVEADQAYAALDAGHQAIIEASEQIEAPTNGGFTEEYIRYSDLPAEISDWLVSPIHGGPELIQRLLREAGPDAVNERLRNPPDTTEQLFHVEKYESREPALDLAALDSLIESVLPSESWTPLGPRAPGAAPSYNRLGEYYLRLLIAASTGRDAEAETAAAGWGGDRLQVYQGQDGASRLALWAIAFDDQVEHAEGMAGLREWLIAFSNGFAWGEHDGRILGWDGPDSAIRVVDGGTVAWLIAASDIQSADQTAAALRDAETPTLWSVR